MKQGFTNDRCLLVRVLPISAIHSVVSMVLGLFVACLVTLSCNTSDVLIELIAQFFLDIVFNMWFSRYVAD